MTRNQQWDGSSGIDALSWGYAEDYVEPSDELRQATLAGSDLGVETLSNGVTTALTFLATAIRAKHVVQVGTGSGSAGLALFAGMTHDGIITSIDTEGDRQSAARQVFTSAKIASNRFRLIAGVPLEVLPKLRDGAYDLVFIDGDKLEYVEYVAQALRLLRHGGMVVVNDALWRGLVAHSSNEDDETVIIREALASVLDTEEFTPVLLPVGGGLLAAIKA
ncbi:MULTISPECIES: O-methyltransferase [Aestuariimicrobium]|uniref:O-methyltransferase n=1 Tax=Aestuariimicrobium TaxID=396388 RepID=UPI0003B48E41|nr:MULTISPECIES: class I SAM-dependent methyltransferase [Aestuariimicrobium]CAI9400119.1 Putative O-methyltransferase [Aestuariimicrobium sp. T2.26MG-19.2B]